MHDSGSQAANRGQLLGTRHRAVRFDARGDVLANCDHMGHFVAFVNAHGNLADQPMICLAILAYRFLLNAVNFAGGENLAELTFQ